MRKRIVTAAVPVSVMECLATSVTARSGASVMASASGAAGGFLGDGRAAMRAVSAGKSAIDFGATGRIFFSAHADALIGGGIYSILPDGSNAFQHASLASGNWASFAVSPGARTLALQPAPASGFVFTDLHGGFLGNLLLAGGGRATIVSATPWLDKNRLILVQDDSTLPAGNLVDRPASGPGGRPQGGNEVGPWEEWGGAAIDPHRVAHGRPDLPGGASVLAIMDLESGQDSKIETGGLDIWPISYDPNADFLYCQASVGVGKNAWSIYHVRPDGTGLKRLTSERAGVKSFAPAVSPSGRQVAYIRQRSGTWWESGVYDLCVMNADGTNKRVVLTGLDLFGTRFTQLSPLVWANQ